MRNVTRFPLQAYFYYANEIIIRAITIHYPVPMKLGYYCSGHGQLVCRLLVVGRCSPLTLRRLWTRHTRLCFGQASPVSSTPLHLHRLVCSPPCFCRQHCLWCSLPLCRNRSCHRPAPCVSTELASHFCFSQPFPSPQLSCRPAKERPSLARLSPAEGCPAAPRNYLADRNRC